MVRRATVPSTHHTINNFQQVFSLYAKLTKTVYHFDGILTQDFTHEMFIFTPSFEAKKTNMASTFSKFLCADNKDELQRRRNLLADITS
jgi:hypothetical protein